MTPIMKKFVIIAFFLIASQEVFAQYQGQFRASTGNDYGIGSNLFGMNFSAEYFLIDRVSFAPNVSVLFPQTGKASNLHIDARYYFTEEKAQWYGVLGFANYRRRYEFNPDITYENNPTLNIGGGLLFKFIDELGINGEIKWQPQNSGEVILKIGAVYFIN